MMVMIKKLNEKEIVNTTTHKFGEGDEKKQ